MPYRLGAFSGVGLDEALLRLVIDEHTAGTLPRLRRLWTYYRNPAEPVGVGGAGGGRAFRLAQEEGLPPRLTGRGLDGAHDDRAGRRREIVVENDIAWRIHTMVDFMFGRPLTIASTASDERTRRLVERALDAMWEGSGGIALLQDMALLGHVYGHVDLLLRTDGLTPRPAGASDEAAAVRAARQLRVEAVEPTRGIPILDPSDYRRILAYVVHVERRLNEPERPGALERLFRRPPARRRLSTHTEVIAPGLRHTYDDETLTGQWRERWIPHDLPVVHVQNVAQPFRYEGLGEVEPLIPLQDELNTRLSDRASRVTFQSFKMYLAKGLDGFERFPVGPGQIWSTDNMEASIAAFGGDADSPSERDHVQEVREALDKISGVPPLAAGVVRAKIGNLSSANALRITLMSILARTARKRITYGRGIAEVSRLALKALDAAGALRTSEDERGVRLVWPDPLPVDLHEQVLTARAKQELGVSPEQLLHELGYGPRDAGLT